MIPEVKSEKVKCPKCGAEDEHPPAIRTAEVEGFHLIDVGWRCLFCNHEWGFEYANDVVTVPTTVILPEGKCLLDKDMELGGL